MAKPNVKFRVKRPQNVLNALEKTRRKVVEKGIKKSLTQSSQVIAKTAKSIVRTRYKLLKNAIGYRVRKAKRTHDMFGVIGPRYKKWKMIDVSKKRKVSSRYAVNPGARPAKKRKVRKSRQSSVQKIYPTKYAHLVEFGTSNSRAYPFLRPAFKRHEGMVKSNMIRSVREATRGP